MRRRPTVLGPRWRSRSVASMDTTSSHIEDDVRAQIAGDPRVPYPAEIAVEVVDRIATLRGTVGSFAQRHAAVADARRTAGVEYVEDWLEVRLLDRDRREDAELRGAALQRLESDSEIPGDAIRVSVKDAGSPSRATSSSSTRATRPSTWSRACTASPASPTRSG